MSIRLRQICLVAEKLAPVLEDFKAVLGLEVCFKDPEVAVFGLKNSLMPVGSNFIEVVAPVKENTAAGRYLKRRNGDGGYMVICQCDSHATQLARKQRAAALNVRLVLDHYAKGFHAMQLHPADTGGAFFEIDWDAKGEPEGNWMPAGGSGWTVACRNDVVSAYSAVELQSADPRGLAERWAAIAELPLRNDARGRIGLPLDNAAVRFVEATDGRGEGLSGIDVVVADRKRLLEAAQRRGLRKSDDQVEICARAFTWCRPTRVVDYMVIRDRLSNRDRRSDEDARVEISGRRDPSATITKAGGSNKLVFHDCGAINKISKPHLGHGPVSRSAPVLTIEEGTLNGRL